MRTMTKLDEVRGKCQTESLVQEIATKNHGESSKGLCDEESARHAHTIDGDVEIAGEVGRKHGTINGTKRLTHRMNVSGNRCELMETLLGQK